MKRLITLAAGLLLLHTATAIPVSAEKTEPAVEDSRDEFLPPAFQGGDKNAFRNWVIRNLRFPADRYDPGDRIEVVVSFAIDKKGAVTDLEIVKSESRYDAERICKTMALSPAWTPALQKGKPVKSEFELHFAIRLVPAPEGQEALGLGAEDMKIYSEAETKPRFCGGGPKRFREWMQRQVDSLMEPHPMTESERLVVRFVIEKDGSMSPPPMSEEHLNDTLWQAVRHALEHAPAWTPAVLCGERVRFWAAIPVVFGPGAAEAEYTDDEAYQVVEVYPRFKNGGISEFREWLMRSVSYPEKMLRNRVQGRVVVSFVVERDGLIGQMKILESPDPEFSKEALRVLKSSPRWTPGTQDGKAVRVKYTLPLDFRLQQGLMLPREMPFGYDRKSTTGQWN